MFTGSWVPAVWSVADGAAFACLVVLAVTVIWSVRNFNGPRK